MHQYNFFNIFPTPYFCCFIYSTKQEIRQRPRSQVTCAKFYSECQTNFQSYYSLGVFYVSMCQALHQLVYIYVIPSPLVEFCEVGFINILVDSQITSKFIKVIQLVSRRARIHIRFISLQSSFLYYGLSFRDHSHMLGQCSPSFGMWTCFVDIEVVQSSIFLTHLLSLTI